MRHKPIIVILALCLLLPTAMSAQKVTGNFSSTTLGAVLDEVEARTGYHFIFDSNEINTTIPVTASFKDASITSVLDKILGPTMHYSINGKYVTISKVQNSVVRKENVRSVKGTVISSSDNQPIVGVGVYVAGTTTGTVTDVDGNFDLRLPDGAVTVTFECIGYDRKELTVEELSKIRIITLSEVANTLDDVVVVGFGTQKRESLVGAVQAVKPSELRASTSNLSTSFAGRIAGVISVQSTGEPGVADGATFWIRGISTFGSGQSPLYIVDGVEVTAQMLNNIAPETIESFSILKDATATSLRLKGSQRSHDHHDKERTQRREDVHQCKGRDRYLRGHQNSESCRCRHLHEHIQRGSSDQRKGCLLLRGENHEHHEPC